MSLSEFSHDYGLALDNGNMCFKNLIMLLRMNMVELQKKSCSRSIMTGLLDLMDQRAPNLLH